MFTGRIDGFRIWFSVISIVCFLSFANSISTAAAQQVGVDEELVKQQKIVDRFLRVLEKNPRRGTALDRVYGFHVESATLDTLIQRYQERTKKNPQEGVAWMILGLIESQRGRDAAAVEAFSKAVAVSANDPLPAYYLGQSQVLVGQPDQAVKAFELALTRKPAQADLLEIFQALGRVHQRAQRTQEALEVWARLEKLFPNDARVQEEIAAALAEENQSALALPRYEKLIQLTKDDYRKAVYRIEAAELKVKLNRSQEAIGDLEKLLATLNPSSWLHREVRRKIDDVFLRTDDQDGLAKYYLASVRKNAEDVDGMARLARILARQGRVPEAQVWLDKALKLAPTRKELRQTFIDQLVEDQRFTEAIAQYELLDKAEPNNPDILREWGKLILRETSKPKEDRLKLAEKVWRRLLISKPKDPLIATQVADLFRHSEMGAAALELYQKAVALAPNEPQYLEYLGEYYHQLKREEEALTTWKKITQGEKRTATNLARLAEVLSSFGYLKQSIPEIQAACTLEPKDLSLHIKAADLLTKAEQYPAALEELTKAESLVQNAEESELILSAQLKVYQLDDSLTRRAGELDKETQSAQPTDRQLYLLARYQEVLNKHSEATRAIAGALKLQPRSLPFMAAGMRIYQKAGQLQAAADLGRQLVNVDRRGRNEYLKHIAELEAQLGRIDEALKAGRDLIASTPSDSDVYQFYASLCFRLGKADEGLQTLQRAVRVNPDDAKLPLMLADALARQYRTDEAIELYWQSFEKSTSLDEKLSRVETLTSIHLETNRLDTLLERLDRIRRDSDDKRVGTICLAQAYNSASDYANSRKVLESLMTENTRDALLLLQLSRLAENEEDWPTAVKYQEQLANLVPGPETEYRLASLLVKGDESQESIGILVRLLSKEEDLEKFLEGVDRLLASRQLETVLELVKSRRREDPKNWELMYREAVALVKKQPEAAAQRFRTLLALTNSDDERGIVKKNRLARTASTLSLQSEITRSAQDSGDMVRLRCVMNPDELVSPLFDSIEAQVGGLGRSQQPAFWMPDEFGLARIAAITWLYHLASATQKQDKMIVEYQSAAQQSHATARQLADWIWLKIVGGIRVESIVLDEDTKPAIRRLATVNDAMGQYLFLSRLGSSETDEAANNEFTSSERSKPISSEDLALMSTCLKGLIRRADELGVTRQFFELATRYLSELKNAGKVGAEQEFYAALKRDARTTADLTFALILSTDRNDVSGALDLFGRWSTAFIRDQRQPSELEEWTVSAITKLIGTNGAAKNEAACVKILDFYFANYQNVVRENARNGMRQKKQFMDQSEVFLTGWYGTEVLESSTQLLAPESYLSLNDLCVLWTAYQSFARCEHFDVLKTHYLDRLKQATDHEKTCHQLALAYLYAWHNEDESSLKILVSVSSSLSQDWQVRLALARTYLRLGQIENALMVAESVTATDQESLRARELLMLDLAIRSGEQERARQAAQRLFGLKLNASDEVQLANQMRRLGMHEQLDAMMARARRQAGNQLSAMVMLMSASQGQGREEIATQIAYQIMRRTRNHQPANYYGWGGTDDPGAARHAAIQVLKTAGKLQDFIIPAEEHLQRSPDSERVIATLKELYKANGQTQKLEELEQREQLRSGDGPEHQFLRAQKLLNEGKSAEAFELIQVAVKSRAHLLPLDFYRIINFSYDEDYGPVLERIVTEMDLRKLGGRDQATRIALVLMNEWNHPGAGLILWRKIWDSFPDSRLDMTLQHLKKREDVIQSAEMYSYAKQVLLPSKAHVAIAPWTGLDKSTMLGDEDYDSLFRRVFDAAIARGELAELRSEIDTHAKAMPEWQAGPVMLAIVDARLGDISSARAVLERVTTSNDLQSFPVASRTMLCEELTDIEELRPFVIKMYESMLETAVTAKTDSSFEVFTSLRERLVAVCQKWELLDPAKRVLAMSLTHARSMNAENDQQLVRRLDELADIALQYENVNEPLQALRIRRQIQSEIAAVGLKPGGTTEYQNLKETYDNRTQLSTIIERFRNVAKSELIPALYEPNEAIDQPAFDLMFDTTDDQDKLPQLNCEFANLVTSQKLSTEVTSSILKRLAASADQRPSDLSLRVVATLLAISSGTADEQSEWVSVLKSYMARMATDPQTADPHLNGRQRQFARDQISLSFVALQCYDDDRLRSDAEILFARALEAARRSGDPRLILALHLARAKAAFAANDQRTAKADLQAILDQTLLRQQVQQSESGAVIPAVPPNRLSVGAAVNTRTFPLTVSQFYVAMYVAETATEHNFTDIAMSAIVHSLAGGRPVTNIETSRGSRSDRIRQGLRESADPDAEIETLIAERLTRIAGLWRKKGHPAQLFYGALHAIVLPKSRLDEVAMHRLPLRSWENPASVGRELIRYAVASRETDALRSDLLARKARSKSPNAGVLLVLLDVELQQYPAAIAELMQLAKLVKQEQKRDVALTAAHAVAMSMKVPELATSVVPLLETVLPLLAEQPRVNECERLLAKHYLETKNIAALRSFYDAQLKANQIQRANDVDHALALQYRDLANIVSLVSKSTELPLTLEYLGRLVDLPRLAAHVDAEPGSLAAPLGFLTWRIRALPPLEQYTLLRDWTLPTNRRQSLRFLWGQLGCAQIPVSFVPPAFSRLGEPPASELVSNFSLLVDAAQKAGKLADLQALADDLVKAKLPLSEHLSTLVAVRRGDASSNEKLLALVDRTARRVSGDGEAEDQPRGFSNARVLDLQILEAALQSEKLRSSGRIFGKSILIERPDNHQYHTCVEDNDFHLPLAANLLARSQSLELGVMERQQVQLANTRLWHASSPPQLTGKKTPAALWTAQDGHLTHSAGPQVDHFLFRYPVAGSFEFSVDAQSNEFSEGEVGYGGLVYEPRLRNDELLVWPVSRQDFVIRLSETISRNRWNRHTIRVTPEAVRFYTNGQLAYSDTAPSTTSPWLHVTAFHHHRASFRNFKLVGVPIIPREVQLTSNNQMDGWMCRPNENLPERISLNEDPLAKMWSRARLGYDYRNNYWKIEDGILEGRQAPDAVSDGYVYYFRPLQDGDTLNYEFFYEPEMTMVHPAIGDLALILNPSSVRSRWLDRTRLGSEPLGIDDEVNENQFRRGPVKLPLKTGDWNGMHISVSKGTVALKLNGTVIFERPLEATNSRQFGLCYDRIQSNAKVRKIVLAGNWPERLSAEEAADLLVPKNPKEIESVARVRRAIIGEETFADDAYNIVMKARTLPVDRRYDLLCDWVLPSASHSTIRVRVDVLPNDPRVAISNQTPTSNGEHSQFDGKLISPAIELVNTAAQLNKLDDLHQAIHKSVDILLGKSRESLALETLVAIAKKDDSEVRQLLTSLYHKLEEVDPKTKLIQCDSEFLAVETALGHPEFVNAALPIAELLWKRIEHSDRPSDLSIRVTALRSKARLLDSVETAGFVCDRTHPALTQWNLVKDETAETRQKGFSSAIWSAEKGVARFYVQHGRDAFYFRSPLRGDFEVHFQSKTSMGKGPGLMYAGINVDKGAKKGRGRDEGQTEFVDQRLVVRNGQCTMFIGGKQIATQEFGKHGDPWLMIRPSIQSFDGSVKDVQIVGLPTVPDVLSLSADASLDQWRQDYFHKNMNQWKKDRAEIVSVSNLQSVEVAQQVVLRYHRPLLEDGDIQYEYFYEAGKTEIHPALDRAVFMISAAGVQFHALTDGDYERSDLVPDNAVPLPGAAKDLPLREKSWNTAKLSLRGDMVILSLNGTKIAEYRLEDTNQRVFGLFHYNNTAARIRNVTYRGDWPKEIPPVPQQELAAPN